MSSRKLIYILGGLVAILVFSIVAVLYVRANTNATMPAAVATSAQPVIQPSPGWSVDPLGLDGENGQGWSVDPLGLDEQKPGGASNGGADLAWLGNIAKILILTVLVLFVSRVLSISRARSHGESDGLSVWLGGVFRLVLGPDPRPSLWFWITNLLFSISVPIGVFFFWSDILVICLIPVAIMVAILFSVGKGALVGEALEGIFTGVIIKKIVKDPAKSAEEAKQNALAKLYKDLYDNDEVVNPDREETIKKEIAILRGEKS